MRRVFLALTVLTVVAVAALVPRSALAAQVKLAVLEFAAQPGTGADWQPLGKGFQEMILVDLSQAGSVEVVERRAVREQRLALGLALPGSTAERRSLGQKSGATHVLSGGFSVSGQTLTLTAELLDVDGGSILLEHSIDGQAEAFFELEKQVVQASIGALDVSLSARERAETGRLHTADFLAFQDFSRGLDEFDAERYEASLRSLRSATERDAQFSLASLTLDQYTRIIQDIRDKADAIEVVKAEQERLEELAEVSEDVEVIRRLLEIARREGPEHQRERLAALHILAMAYGNEGRNRSKLRDLRDREDQFAMQRASDELWAQYHREATALWPQVPVQVGQQFWGGFPALDTFDKDFAYNVDKLWEQGKDYPDNRIKYLQDNLRYPYHTGQRIHLSLAEQVQMHHDFVTEYAPKIPAKEWWYKHEYDELLDSYASVLRFDDSTRLLKRMADEADNEHKLRSLAGKIEVNQEYVKLLRGAADRRRMEEWVMLAMAEGWSKGPILTQGREHFDTKGPLDAEGAELITRVRDWPGGAADGGRGWLRLDRVPAWCAQHCYWVWTGPRSDPRVTESVRFYKQADKEVLDQPVLFLDSAPRSDIDAGFTVSWTAPDDFRPHGFEPPKGDPPGVAFMVRLVDLKVKRQKDPQTDEYVLSRPMRGVQVRVTPQHIAVEQVTEAQEYGYYRTRRFDDKVVRQVKLKKRLRDGARIGLSLKGRQLAVVVDGKTVLNTRVDVEPAGFAGLRMTGLGYAEVSDVVISDLD